MSAAVVNVEQLQKALWVFAQDGGLAWDGPPPSRVDGIWGPRTERSFDSWLSYRDEGGLAPFRRGPGHSALGTTPTPDGRSVVVSYGSPEGLQEMQAAIAQAASHYRPSGASAPVATATTPLEVPIPGIPVALTEPGFVTRNRWLIGGVVAAAAAGGLAWYLTRD